MRKKPIGVYGLMALVSGISMTSHRWLGDREYSGHRRRFLSVAGLIALAYGLGEASPRDLSLPAAKSSGRESADPKGFELEMASVTSSAFAEAASLAGMAVSPEEVAQRLEVYQRLYPGERIDISKVKDIVLAEKYLAAKGIGAGNEEWDGGPAGSLDASHFPTPEAAEKAKLALRTQHLLARQEVRREAAKLRDLAQIERQSRHKPDAQWEPPQLQIQGDPGECLAWSGSSCFLTLQEYNAACTQFQVPARLELDSAKSSVLRNYLLQKRRAELARKGGLEQNPDSIVERERMARDSHKWTRSARKFGFPAYDEASLQAAYGRYHAQYFAVREKVVFALVGSTDSAYIDSLHRIFSAWDKAAGIAKGKGMTPHPPEPSLPWVHFRSEELPMELRGPADSLGFGRANKPLATSYGHFLVRLSQVTRTGEIAFEKAYDRLRYLVARENFLSMDSVIEAKARRYYAENQFRYAIPDTMALRAWLIPAPIRRVAMKAGGKASSPALSDTAIFAAGTTNSLVLPAEIRIQLQESVRKDSLKAFVGPLSDKYGRWYFRILSRKPSRRILPYRLARKDVLERITAPLTEIDPGSATEESISEVLLTMGLSEAYLSRDQRALDPYAPPESSHQGGKARSMAEEIALNQAQLEKFRMEEEKLLEGTRVNLAPFRR